MEYLALKYPLVNLIGICLGLGGLILLFCVPFVFILEEGMNTDLSKDGEKEREKSRLQVVQFATFMLFSGFACAIGMMIYDVITT